RPPAPSWGREHSSAVIPSAPYVPDSVSDLHRDAGIPPSDDFELSPLSRPRRDVGAIAPGALSLDLPEGGTTFDDLEREILVQVLARAENNQSRAARSLGMSERTFRSRMKRLGLKS